jgi:hypothetical protein
MQPKEETIQMLPLQLEHSAFSKSYPATPAILENLLNKNPKSGFKRIGEAWRSVRKFYLRTQDWYRMNYLTYGLSHLAIRAMTYGAI